MTPWITPCSSGYPSIMKAAGVRSMCGASMLHAWHCFKCLTVTLLAMGAVLGLAQFPEFGLPGQVQAAAHVLSEVPAQP